MIAKYNSVDVSVKGWIKKLDGPTNSETGSNTDPNYDCDITISAVLEGKELSINVTKILAGMVIYD